MNAGSPLQMRAAASPTDGDGDQAWQTARRQLEGAARLLALKPGLHELLATPRRAVEVAVPIRAEGELKTFVGYRVQHSSTRGPVKGGLRYHPDVSLSLVKALAMWMTWKVALVDRHLHGRARTDDAKVRE